MCKRLWSSGCLDLTLMTVESPFAEKLNDIPVEHHEVEVLGSTTQYWTYGPSDATTTIVVVHGYRGEHHGLEPVVAHLPEYRIISPDLPGFGESSPLTDVDHSIGGYVAWLGAFFSALDLDERTVLLGHSFGTIVTSAAVASGLSPQALVLVNPIAISGLEGPHKFATKLTVGYYGLAARLPERLGTALLNSWLVVQFMSVSLVKTRDRALRRWIHHEHHTFFSRFSDRNTVVEAFDASVSTDVSGFASALRLPTLLVAAEQDDITPVAAQYVLQRAIPDARLRVLADVGHLIHYEKPAEAAEAIRDFVDGLPRS